MSSRCAIWVRVSTDEQESGNQLDELRAWAARRGLDVAAEYIIDGASAWKGKHRDQVAVALADARLGQFDVLLVWALDRLDREGVESTLGLLRRFQAAGAPVWSLREPWTETADPHTAELLGAIYAWMARAESARRSERVKAGLARPRAEGKPVGRRAGSKDLKPRKRSGYYARWERERAQPCGGS
jgi:DNA invertase Pin-like site-specific DNA recombinase